MSMPDWDWVVLLSAVVLAVFAVDRVVSASAEVATFPVFRVGVLFQPAFSLTNVLLGTTIAWYTATPYLSALPRVRFPWLG